MRFRIIPTAVDGMTPVSTNSHLEPDSGFQDKNSSQICHFDPFDYRSGQAPGEIP